jgi:uncharacterized protein
LVSHLPARPRQLRRSGRWKTSPQPSHEQISLFGIRVDLKQGTSIVIRVKVKPNSRVSSFEPVEDGTWLARLRSAPIDGAANEELRTLIAKHFHCPKSLVSIKSGAASRMKRVRIPI